MKTFLSFVLTAMILNGSAQTVTEKKIIYSQHVKDSFELYITHPDIMSDRFDYDLVIYLDANLRSGKKMREMIESGRYHNKVARTVFVGVGHIGNYHVLRRRDFILPAIKGTDTVAASLNYGHAEDFYQFLKTELIPALNTQFRIEKNTMAIEGHSLGGLFVFYCLFKSEQLFDNFFALSPALWIDHYNIFNLNQLNHTNNSGKTIYISAGKREVMNRILKGVKKMKKVIEVYPYMTYSYEVYAGKNHNTAVVEALDALLTTIPFRIIL